MSRLLNLEFQSPDLVGVPVARFFNLAPALQTLSYQLDDAMNHPVPSEQLGRSLTLLECNDEDENPRKLLESVSRLAALTLHCHTRELHKVLPTVAPLSKTLTYLDILPVQPRPFLYDFSVFPNLHTLCLGGYLLPLPGVLLHSVRCFEYRHPVSGANSADAVKRLLAAFPRLHTIDVLVNENGTKMPNSRYLLTFGS